MSLVNFTKKVSSGETCQDLVFDFGSKDDDPLLAHGVIVGFYSSVFSKLINEGNNNRDSLHRIQIQVTDSNKKTFETFISGIYHGFTDNASKTVASKDFFQLVHKYQLQKNLVENLFSVTNVWHCLQLALASPEDSPTSFLLGKCKKMLKINKSVYKDAKALTSVDASTIIHALSQKNLPLKKKEVREFIDLWKEVNKEKENIWEELAKILDAGFMIWERDDSWQTAILNVSSPDLTHFSVEYETNASVQDIVEQTSFITQVEKALICVHKTESGPEIDVDSKKNLEELGIKENDEVTVKLKKMITFREVSGGEHQVQFSDDETVKELKLKIYKKLEATVKAFQLILVKDKTPLEEDKTLFESGLQSGSHVSVIVGDRIPVKRILDDNVAADVETKLTASRTHPSLLPKQALPGGPDSIWGSGKVGEPSWWCAQFSEPKIIGRLKLTQRLSDYQYMSFRVEVGNDNQNWTTVLTQENETSPKGQECTYDLDDHLPSKFCRIYIERMGDSKFAELHKVIMNEAIFE